MTSPSVSNVAVSLIWTQVLPGLAENHGMTGPLAALVSGPTYEPVFDGAGATPNDLDERFSLPWAHPVGQGFWKRYLQRQTMAGLPGPAAWSALVPVRERLGPVSTDAEGTVLVLEAFYYPFGLGLVFTVRLRRSLELGAAVEELFRLTKAASLQVQIDGASEAWRLPELGPAVLARLQSGRFGNSGESAQPLVEPFSVCTIVQADDDSALQAPLDPAGPVRRALHGLASWSPTWRADSLPDLAECVLLRTSAPPGHLTYLGDRGRVVWFPAFFSPDAATRHSLSCYHRNLVLASLTVDSLSSLLLDTDRRLGAAGSLLDLHPDTRECVQHAAARLSDLYSGSTGTYKSKSAQLQITQNGGRDALNRLAGRLQLAALP